MLKLADTPRAVEMGMSDRNRPGSVRIEGRGGSAGREELGEWWGPRGAPLPLPLAGPRNGRGTDPGEVSTLPADCDCDICEHKREGRQQSAKAARELRWLRLRW